MLRIFTTQLTGYFKQMEEEVDAFEDAAHAVSQAIVGDGHIYFHGFGEMDAVTTEAINGQEPFPKALPLYQNGNKATITPRDRIVIATRYSSDATAIELVKSLQAEEAMTIGISADVHANDESFAELVDFHLDTKLTNALVPMDNGERIGFPAVMTALFAYYGLFLYTKEILEEYE